MIYTAENINSSLIKEIYWNSNIEELTVVFHKFWTPFLVHSDFTRADYNKFISAESVGNYYLSHIKNKFKIMSEQKKDPPNGINQASEKKRFIKIRLNVDKIKKEWIMAGEKGNYLDLTLLMLPNGQVDKFENLGMVIQDVPKSVYEKDKNTKGEILGNGKENLWSGSGAESGVGFDLGNNPALVDDLPF